MKSYLRKPPKSRVIDDEALLSPLSTPTANFILTSLEEQATLEQATLHVAHQDFFDQLSGIVSGIEANRSHKSSLELFHGNIINQNDLGQNPLLVQYNSNVLRKYKEFTQANPATSALAIICYETLSFSERRAHFYMIWRPANSAKYIIFEPAANSEKFLTEAFFELGKSNCDWNKTRVQGEFNCADLVFQVAIIALNNPSFDAETIALEIRNPTRESKKKGEHTGISVRFNADTRNNSLDREPKDTLRKKAILPTPTFSQAKQPAAPTEASKPTSRNLSYKAKSKIPVSEANEIHSQRKDPTKSTLPKLVEVITPQKQSAAPINHHQSAVAQKTTLPPVSSTPAKVQQLLNESSRQVNPNNSEVLLHKNELHKILDFIADPEVNSEKQERFLLEQGASLNDEEFVQFISKCSDADADKFLALPLIKKRIANLLLNPDNLKKFKPELLAKIFQIPIPTTTLVDIVALSNCEVINWIINYNYGQGLLSDNTFKHQIQNLLDFCENEKNYDPLILRKVMLLFQYCLWDGERFEQVSKAIGTEPGFSFSKRNKLIEALHNKNFSEEIKKDFEERNPAIAKYLLADQNFAAQLDLKQRAIFVDFLIDRMCLSDLTGEEKFCLLRFTPISIKSYIFRDDLLDPIFLRDLMQDTQFLNSLTYPLAKDIQKILGEKIATFVLISEKEKIELQQLLQAMPYHVLDDERKVQAMVANPTFLTYLKVEQKEATKNYNIPLTLNQDNLKNLDLGPVNYIYHKHKNFAIVQKLDVAKPLFKRNEIYYILEQLKYADDTKVEKKISKYLLEKQPKDIAEILKNCVSESDKAKLEVKGLFARLLADPVLNKKILELATDNDFNGEQLLSLAELDSSKTISKALVDTGFFTKWAGKIFGYRDPSNTLATASGVTLARLILKDLTRVDRILKNRDSIWEGGHNYYDNIKNDKDAIWMLACANEPTINDKISNNPTLKNTFQEALKEKTGFLTQLAIKLSNSSDPGGEPIEIDSDSTKKNLHEFIQIYKNSLITPEIKDNITSNCLCILQYAPAELCRTLLEDIDIQEFFVAELKKKQNYLALSNIVGACRKNFTPNDELANGFLRKIINTQSMKFLSNPLSILKNLDNSAMFDAVYDKLLVYANSKRESRKTILNNFFNKSSLEAKEYLVLKFLDENLDVFSLLKLDAKKIEGFSAETLLTLYLSPSTTPGNRDKFNSVSLSKILCDSDDTQFKALMETGKFTTTILKNVFAHCSYQEKQKIVSKLVSNNVDVVNLLNLKAETLDGIIIESIQQATENPKVADSQYPKFDERVRKCSEEAELRRVNPFPDPVESVDNSTMLAINR